MTSAQRKEKALLHKKLIDLLTDCATDTDFLRRLIFANEIISNEIEQFSNEEYMDVVMSLEKGEN